MAGEEGMAGSERGQGLDHAVSLPRCFKKSLSLRGRGQKILP